MIRIGGGLTGLGFVLLAFTSNYLSFVAVFLGRVVGDFRWFGVFKRMRGTAFAWWDTRLFVPLCLLLALGCLVVALSEG